MLRFTGRIPNGILLKVRTSRTSFTLSQISSHIPISSICSSPSFLTTKFYSTSKPDDLEKLLSEIEHNVSKTTKDDITSSEGEVKEEELELDMNKINSLLDDHFNSLQDQNKPDESSSSSSSPESPESLGVKDKVKEIDILDKFLQDEYAHTLKEQNQETETKDYTKEDAFQDFFKDLNLGNDFAPVSNFENELFNTRKLMETTNNDHETDLDHDETSNRETDDLFGHDFLDMGKKRHVINSRNQEEKETLANLFQSLQRDDDSSRPSVEENRALWSHKHAMRETREQFDRTLSSTRIGLSTRYMKELNKQVQEALDPTLQYINGLESSSAIVDYYNHLIEEWYNNADKIKHDETLFETVYLHKLLRESTLDEKHQSFINEIKLKTEQDAQQPILNALTFSVIFNHILRTLAFKHHDGLTALSLYNILKKDLELYTIICNQETYNEILRILWIFRGKIDLYAFEMAYLEMKHCGFIGDYKTFNIVKQVLLDYYQLRFGKAEGINGENRIPIWSLEENNRSKALEGRLRQLFNRLSIDTSMVNRIL
ncbi:hypothetical protein DFJ63DRAFT_318769 [Scheffersomyces coipomensis]|uniref:uncharacterized protein n=1 Tax=Scheffersomyces coipomensis TaxID=1788519 RepID=UPI00315D8EC4